MFGDGKTRLIRLILSLGAVLFASVHESRAQDIIVHTIALSGDPDLSTGDPVIGVGGSVAIDSIGKVMFFVTTERDGTRHVNLATSNGTITSVLPGFDFPVLKLPGNFDPTR